MEPTSFSYDQRAAPSLPENEKICRKTSKLTEPPSMKMKEKVTKSKKNGEALVLGTTAYRKNSDFHVLISKHPAVIV